ncbi:MAG: HD domain-containing phosphohydrolase [Planctomycetota bacterium]
MRQDSQLAGDGRQRVRRTDGAPGAVGMDAATAAVVERLSEVGIALSGEADADRLLELILLAAKDIIGCDGGTIYMVDEEHLRFAIIRTDSLGIAMGGSGGVISFPPVPLYHEDGRPNEASVVAYAVLHDVTVTIADAYHAEGFDFSGTRAFDEQTGYRSRSFLTVPMKNHEDEIIGVLQLLNALDADGTVCAFTEWQRRLAESLASQAATALTRNQLIDGMRDLFEALIRLIAEAIDEKSPYTGGHCRRVPELTLLLADACAAEGTGPLADFRMSDADRYELKIASWLHDCGKITTPDWIMDKATKLSGLRDGIEAVATRYAVLQREAEIACLQAVAAGADASAAEAERDARLRLLADELVFLRRVNRGGEAMSAADQERVRACAARRWRDPEGVEQPLLDADEVENLCIVRGTLNSAERRVIEGHMDATLRMLESLPYPRHLQRVPEYAGGHHEKMDGSGYPRGLRREEMSVPARVMGVADIFEALTARDRPYKPGMPVSRALAILGDMAAHGHIDPDIHAVFLRSGVWRTYADRFLDPAQRDYERVPV